MLTIEEFCTIHIACNRGKEWALQNCKTMQDVWDTAKPEWLVWVATRQGVLSDKELLLFAYWCISHLLTDDCSKWK